MPYKDPAQRKLCHKRWRAANPEKLRLWDRRYRAQHPEQARRARARANRRAAGIDPDAAEKLLAGARLCEGCGSCAKLVPDHNHQTGHLRGALCQACNKALGLLKDNPFTLRTLASYLEMSP